jgi:predicted amidophosphoribosyltransferase
MLKQVMETDGRAPCPMCRERISREAKLCPQCRTDLQQHPGWNNPPGASGGAVLVFLIIIAAAVVAFFMFNR